MDIILHRGISSWYIRSWPSIVFRYTAVESDIWAVFSVLLISYEFSALCIWSPSSLVFLRPSISSSGALLTTSPNGTISRLSTGVSDPNYIRSQARSALDAAQNNAAGRQEYGILETLKCRHSWRVKPTFNRSLSVNVDFPSPLRSGTGSGNSTWRFGNDLY